MNVPYSTINPVSLHQSALQAGGIRTHHNSIPPIPPPITTKNHNPPPLIHNHILTIPNLILKRDFIGREVIYILDEGRVVANEEVSRVEVVDEEGSYEG